MSEDVVLSNAALNVAPKLLEPLTLAECTDKVVLRCLHLFENRWVPIKGAERRLAKLIYANLRDVGSYYLTPFRLAVGATPDGLVIERHMAKYDGFDGGDTWYDEGVARCKHVLEPVLTTGKGATMWCTAPEVIYGHLVDTLTLLSPIGNGGLYKGEEQLPLPSFQASYDRYGEFIDMEFAGIVFLDITRIYAWATHRPEGREYDVELVDRSTGALYAVRYFMPDRDKRVLAEAANDRAIIEKLYGLPSLFE